MMRLLLPWLLAALAACQPAGHDAPGPDETEKVGTSVPDAPALPAGAEGGDPIAAPGDLAGEYRVAGIGDEAIDLPHAITASISQDRIHVVSDCVNLAWSYRLEAGLLSTQRAAVEGCARGLTADEEALVAGFDGADKVLRDATNGYRFSGSGPVVTLYTQ
jgi:hypothetical protein